MATIANVSNLYHYHYSHLYVFWMELTKLFKSRLAYGTTTAQSHFSVLFIVVSAKIDLYQHKVACIIETWITSSSPLAISQFSDFLSTSALDK